MECIKCNGTGLENPDNLCADCQGGGQMFEVTVKPKKVAKVKKIKHNVHKRQKR